MRAATSQAESFHELLELDRSLWRLCQLQQSLLKKGVANQAAPEPERRLRLREVVQRTGLSASSVYRLERLGKFPSRKRVGLRASAWLQSEVGAWLRDPEGWCITQATTPTA